MDYHLLLFQTLELVRCAKVAVRHGFVISSLQIALCTTLAREKIFENIVNLAVEVFKKPGVNQEWNSLVLIG